MSEKCMWKSDIFSNDGTRQYVYLLKTLLFRGCFSNILQAEINYLAPKIIDLAPKRVKLVTTKVTT